MAETPNCNDSQRDLVRKILIEFRSMASNPPDNLLPICNDDITDLYRKILLTLPFI